MCQIPESLIDLYLSFGIALKASQSNENRELPIPAAYIVETNKVITYHFLEEEYKLRADPEEILAALS